METQTTSNPSAEKVNVIFSFTWTWSQHLKSIHMVLHSGLLRLINLRCSMCMLKWEKFVWIGFCTTGFDPNSLGAGPGTQNNMLHFIQSDLLSKRHRAEKQQQMRIMGKELLSSLCKLSPDWFTSFHLPASKRLKDETQ